MPDPSAIQSLMSKFFSGMFSSGSAKYMIYVGYIFWMIIIFGIMALIYFWMNFKYKLTIFEGSIEKGKDGKEIMKILKVKRDRAMSKKYKGIADWKLLFSRKRISPIPFEYIQPNNHVFLFKTSDDTFNPIKMAVGNPSANFVVDPFDAAFFNLGIQQDAREYQKDDILKKQQIIMIATIILCLAAIVLASWFILKYSANTAGKIETAATALESATNVIGPR